MAKGGGSTRTVSANNASASRTNNSASAKLPEGWSLDSMSKSAYHTDIKINDQARYSLKEIYGSSVTFGDGDKGAIINANSLKLAKSVAEDGKNLTDLFKSYNNAKTSENEKFYANEIRRYIAEAKQKRSK